MKTEKRRNHSRVRQLGTNKVIQVARKKPICRQTRYRKRMAENKQGWPQYASKDNSGLICSGDSGR